MTYRPQDSAALSATDQGLKAWSMPMMSAYTNSTVTLGTVWVASLYLPTPQTISTLWVCVVNAGGTLTTGQNFLGLYSAGNALLATTADQTSAWGSTGPISASITPQVVPAGFIKVALVTNGTTSPAFAGVTLNKGAFPGVNRSSSNYRFAYANSGITTALPANLTGASSTATCLWVGVS